MSQPTVTPLVDAPSVVKYGQITGRFVQYIADTADVGNVPDELPLDGKVTLAPLTKVIQFPTTSPPRMAVASTVVANVVAGDLKASHGGPLFVIATDQPAGIPSVVQWQATFALVGISSQPAPVVFNVPAGGVVDLAMAVSVPTTPPAVTVISHVDAATAVAASVAAAASATSAAASAELAANLVASPSDPAAAALVANPNSATNDALEGLFAKKGLSATATLDFPSIAAASQQELTVTLTGAVVGDVVSLAPPAALPAGLAATAYVSAANTVKVRLCNVTAAAVDPASASWKVAIQR